MPETYIILAFIAMSTVLLTVLIFLSLWLNQRWQTQSFQESRRYMNELHMFYDREAQRNQRLRDANEKRDIKRREKELHQFLKIMGLRLDQVYEILGSDSPGESKT